MGREGRLPCKNAVSMSNKAVFTCLVCPVGEGLPGGMEERSKEELVGGSRTWQAQGRTRGPQKPHWYPGVGVRLAQLRVWLGFTGTVPTRNRLELSVHKPPTIPKTLVARKSPAISLAFCCLAFPSRGSPGKLAPKKPSLAPTSAVS